MLDTDTCIFVHRQPAGFRPRLLVGPNDLWIAAHALARDVPLITHNLSEFRRVPDLSVETWMTA